MYNICIECFTGFIILREVTFRKCLRLFYEIQILNNYIYNRFLNHVTM